MPTIRSGFQNGQSIAEFIIAMLVAVPLVLGVIYVGKYEDIKYTAIQASRYAVFERAFDTLPSPNRHEPDLTSEVQARFFTDPMPSHKGAVAFKDRPPSQTAGTLNQNWMGVDGAELVKVYPDIQVTVQKCPQGCDLPNTPPKWVFDASRSLFLTNIPDPGIQRGQVRVKLADVANFSALHNLDLNIDVSTAMLVDGFNADGNGDPNNPDSNSVRGRASLSAKLNQIVPGFSKVLQVGNNAILQWGWEALSDTPGPNFFCVAPDVVPLDATQGARAIYDPAKVCN